ncbi:MAG: amino acid adenylation domain-containing protein [Candidatus Aminicenantes bacterium]|nr:MAG: amino acid adenylation domain-containing protein [Candidatus Aminicenantes bacterium]
MSKKSNVENIYALSPMQEGMLFHAVMDEQSTVYVEQTRFTARGTIDPDLFEKTFNHLIKTYDILRTVFAYKKTKRPRQVVFKDGEVDVYFEDISHLKRGEADTYLETFSQEDRERGFDLTKGPLMRVSLFKVSSDTWHLVWSFHHILMDGWCLGILFNDFLNIYRALKKNEPLEPGQVIPYKNYIQWLENLEKQKGLDYWKNYLEGYEPQTFQPNLRQSSKEVPYKLEKYRFRIIGSLTGKLVKAAAENQVTLNMLIQTLWGILVQRYTNTPDIVFGTVVSGRPPEIHGIERMVGLFINTVPVRIKILPKQRFSQLLADIRQQSVLSKTFEYLPLAEIQANWRPNIQLFDHIMGFENFPLQESIKTSTASKNDPGFVVEDMEEYEQTNYDLNIVVVPGKEIFVKFLFNTSLYEPGFIRRMADHFNEIIIQSMVNPGIEVETIEMLTQEEKQKILVEFNSTTSAYPRDKTIHQLFEEQAKRTPHQIALVGVHETPEKHKNNYNMSSLSSLSYMSYISYISYKELNQKSHQLAWLLIKKGLQPDSIVGIMAERSIEMIIGIIGILKSSGAYMPINPDYPAERTRYLLAESKTKALVTTRTLDKEHEKVRKWEGKKIFLEDLSAFSVSFAAQKHHLHLSPWVNAPITSLAYVIYTSGSTGRPKGVMVEHRNVMRLVKNTNYIEFKKGDRILQTGALDFDASTFEIWGSLLNSLTLYLTAKENILTPEKLKEMIRKYDIGTMWLTSPLFNRLSGVDPGIFEGLRNLLVGGDVLSPFHINRVRGRFPDLNIINGYGPTENTTFSATFLIDKEYIENIPIGKPIANSTAYIIDKYINLQPPGVVGELCVGGDGISRGYLSDPELTAEKFIENPFVHGDRMYKTGDLSRWLPDGNIEFLGRIDSQVKIRGFRIELSEIESQLLKHNEIKEAVVIDRSDTTGDKYLCAYVIPDRMHGPWGMDHGEGANPLREYLSQSLPDYMIPSYFIQIHKIPLTPNGKLNRKALPEPELKAGEDYAAPGNEIQKKLVEIWSDILNIDKDLIGINGNFFELGGHSLKATILVSRIHKELDMKVPLKEVFSRQTVKELAGYIEHGGEDRYVGIEQVEKKEYYALSSAQKRLYFLQQMDLNSSAYNMPLVLSLGKDIQKDRLESALMKLIGRHESLRTSFERVNDMPVQIVRNHVVFSIEYYDLATENIDGKIGSQEARKPGKSAIKNFIRPFDLSQAPLMRSGLIRLPDNHYTWMVDVHHIVSDGTSHMILTEEFMSLYNGEELEPQRLRIQYKDFSEWQNRLIESGRQKIQENYWLELYSDAGEIPTLNLPGDYKRPEVFSFDGNLYFFRVEGEEAVKFRAIALANNGTLYMNILAVLNTLFYKYTGETDIVIGSGIAGRPHVDLQRIIGMFVNTLAMRNYPTGEKSYESFLKEVIARSVKAFENQDVQFEELVQKLNLERDPSRNPLFDTTIVVQNFRDLGQVGEGVSKGAAGENLSQVEVLPLADENLPYGKYENLTSKFDMTFFTYEQGEDFFVKIEYYTSIFKEETVKRLVSHFKNILRAVIKDPAVKLKDIDIISEEEKKQVVFQLNNTAKAYPKDKTIHELFEEQVEQRPDNIAVINHETYEKHERQSNISYKELNERSNHLANYLVVEKHLHWEEAVGVLMERSPLLVVALLGILKAGGVYVPLDPDYPEERLKDIINDAAVKIVISQKKKIKTLNRLQWECPLFRTFLCLDSTNVYIEEEVEKSGLMDEKLWEYIGESASDDITGGGWLTGTTGQPFSRQEMDEYGDNILKKLKPLLHQNMRVLEIGCASGITMYRIAPLVGLYYGTDLSHVTIEKNRKQVQQENHSNIQLACLPAHQIHKLREKNFDLVIINSVIQSFHGHNYLRSVIRKALDLMANKGFLFIGDVMDQDLKESLIRYMKEFKRANPDKNYTTKTDWCEELFISRSFFEDLTVEFPGIHDVEFSDKIHTIENELTLFRYDALLKVDKKPGERKQVEQLRIKPKHKYQEDAAMLQKYAVGSIGTHMQKPCRGIRAQQLAYVIYTSGSSGKPKGVMIEHGSVVRLVKNTNFIEWKQGDSLLPTGALAFDITTFEIWGPLLNGVPLVLVDKSVILNSKEFEKVLHVHQVTHLHLIPQLFDQLAVERPGIFERLDYFLVGGDLVRPRYVNEIRKKYRDLRILHMYGPTENTTFSTFFPVDREYEGALPIGRPIANSFVYILDKCHKLQPVGVFGELCTGGRGVVRGYLNNPELTAEKFVSVPSVASVAKNKIYKTGDMARWNADLQIEFSGRIDQQVKIRGFRIETGEIENQLLGYDDIKEALVTERTNENEDLYLCAYLVPTDERDNKIDLSDLRLYLAGKLPDYMIPTAFVTLGKMPRTGSGKVDKKALPPPGYTVGEKYKPPGDELEKKLVEIWSGVLGIGYTSIGIDDNFFELGGHSLKATTLSAKIHKELGIEVPLAEIFRHPFVRELSGYIKGVKGEKHEYASIEPIEKKDYHTLSAAQKRLYILHQVETDNLGYNSPILVLLEGKLDRRMFEETFQQLISRHESLRTWFLLVQEEPVQVIAAEVDFEIEYYDLATEDTENTEEQENIHHFVRPFDLSAAPLLRVGLIKIDQAEHILMVDMHHIITDGTSQGILIKEFMDLYAGEKLLPLKLQYKDYSEWQNSDKQKNAVKAKEEYWLSQFGTQGDIPILSLPYDYPRPLVQSFEGNTINFEIGKADTEALNALALKEETTLYMLLLSIYYVFLAKVSGQEDIIVGMPTAGRRHDDLREIIGMFINTLALRNFPGGEKPFKKFLQEIKQNTLEVFENQEYQFEELVEKLAVERDASRNPLFDTLFALQNVDIPELEIHGLKVKPYDYETRTARFDLTLQCYEIKEGLWFHFEYCTVLFREETIQRFIGYFKRIITAVLEDSQVKLSQIEILPEHEKKQVLVDFNGTKAGYPHDKTIHQLFQEQAERTPDQAAIVGSGQLAVGKEVNIHLTYRELNRQSNQLAQILQQKGVQPETIAGIMVERSIEMIIGILGILKSGGAYLPINPKDPGERIKYLLTDSGAKILVTISTFADPGRAGVCSNWQPATGNWQLAYIIYTSGSTGNPKGVPITHSNFSPLVHWGYRHLAIGPEDRTIQNLSYFFDWSVWEIFITLTTGAVLYMIADEVLLNPESEVDFIQEKAITVLHITPTLYQYLVNVGKKLETLRYLFIGAEKLTVDLVKRSIKSVSEHCRIFNMYGPTEATIISTVLEIHRSRVGEYEKLSSVPIGRPVGNTALLVLDNHMKMCPIGVTGELYIAGDGLAPGYLNNPELTAQKFQIPNPEFQTNNEKKGTGKKIYKTGDSARWLTDGNIEFLGRLDHQVKIRGFRIEIEEIETRLLNHDEIKEAVVVDRVMADGDRYLCAYIVGVGNIETPDIKELREYLSRTLPDYMIPSYFVRLDRIPGTASGKIDRKALPTPDPGVGVDEYRAPRNTLEKKLMEMWASVLGIEKESISIDANFFQLGGHSLKATILTAKIHKKFGVKVPLAEIFKHPTIRGLALIMKAAEKEKYAPIEPAEEKHFYELSYNQKRLWIIHQLAPESSSYNMRVEISLHHQVNSNFVRKTLKRMVMRHESLRTVFKEIDDQPRQFILKNENVDVPFKIVDISYLDEKDIQEKKNSLVREAAETPFNLSNAPLFRAVLIKLEEARYDFVFTMHHIISDGWSLTILKHEFFLLYNGYQAGKNVELESLKLQYKDFSEWSNQQLSDPFIRVESHRSWRKKLKQGIPILKLRRDFNQNGDVDDHKGAGYRWLIGKEINDQLRQRAQAHKTSLFIIMFTVYILMLYRFSNQEEIACSIIASGREHLSLNKIIGFFVNSVVFKVHVDHEESFEDFLQRVHEEVLEIFQHQTYPLELVCDDLKMQYPDVPVSFNMLNIQDETMNLDMEPFEPIHMADVGDVKFDMESYIMEYKNGIEIYCSYKKNMFTPNTIEFMMKEYMKLLEFFASHPSESYRTHKLARPKETIWDN